MAEKIEGGQYAGVGDWLADAELIVSNCRAYNHSTSGIVLAAKKFEQCLASAREGPLFLAAAAAAGAGAAGAADSAMVG